MLEWVRGYEFLEGQHYNNQYAKYRQFIQQAEGKKNGLFRTRCGYDDTDVY